MGMLLKSRLLSGVLCLWSSRRPSLCCWPPSSHLNQLSKHMGFTSNVQSSPSHCSTAAEGECEDARASFGVELGICYLLAVNPWASSSLPQFSHIRDNEITFLLLMFMCTAFWMMTDTWWLLHNVSNCDYHCHLLLLQLKSKPPLQVTSAIYFRLWTDLLRSL